MLDVLRYFRRTPPVHEHKFDKLVRLIGPRRDVLDCACGMRRIVEFGALGASDRITVVTKGSSLDNVLINKSSLPGE